MQISRLDYINRDRMELSQKERIKFINNCKIDEEVEHLDLMCWEWLGKTNKKKEPIFEVKGEKKKAIHVAYFIFKGDFNPKLNFEMICEKKNCVNPDHIDFIRVNKTEIVDKIMKILNERMGSYV